MPNRGALSTYKQYSKAAIEVLYGERAKVHGDVNEIKWR